MLENPSSMTADSVTPIEADPGATTWNERFLAQWAGADRPAVVTPDQAWSGRELVERAIGAAGLLTELVDVGSPVPALIDGSPTAIALAAGGALAARPLAPIGTRLPPDDLAAVVRGLRATVVVASSAHADRAASVAAATGAAVVVVDEVAASPDAPPASVGPDAGVAVLHTSGTTGAPVPVVARQRAIAARVDVYQQVMPLGPGDRFCSFSGFHHTTGITMSLHALAVGAAVLPVARFTLDAWRDAGGLSATHVLLVPTMLDLLLDAGALGEVDPRVVLYGAAPIEPAVLEAAMAVRPQAAFLQIFGQTEVSPITALTPDDHRRAVAGEPALLATVGRAVPGVEVQVTAPDSDGVGELVVRAPHAFTVGAAEARAVGDLARIDADGYVTLLGRVGDRIVWAGENIHPAEVEAAIASHPAVREVAVVGVPDRRYGEVVRAVVVLADPAARPTDDQLTAHATARLARFKVPTEWVVVDVLPRNANGKVLRRLLR
jgi:acyl-CoA synthetase (AMP-forming)/AMP-acid ligase II